MRRPDPIEVTSLAQLYEDYERILLEGNPTRNDFSSDSGHVVTVFDRNFFHLVKLRHPKLSAPGGTGKFYMPDEKDLIRAQAPGFGLYQCDQVRARNLPAVCDTLLEPDDVHELEGGQAAKLVFIKNYSDNPYPFFVVLVGPSDDCPLVLVTAVSATANRAKNKWRTGKRIWPVA